MGVKRTPMASAGARAYNGGPGGQSPRWGSSPPAANEAFVFKTEIFNASATFLHEMMYYFSCFFCKVSKYKLIYSQRTKIKITRRSRLRQNRCVFSAPRNYCPRDRSRWRRLSGRLFHSSIVLRLMDSDRICSLTIAGQHLSIIRQVHWLCLGLTGRLREKRTKSEESSAI